MTELSLVTGANGHLGSNLVRALLADGREVRASVRDVSRAGPVDGLGAQVVCADLMDKPSLLAALAGVDTLYQVAGVFRHWSRDRERDIVTPNVQGTRNILEAAARAGVRKIIYVSSNTTVSPPPGSSRVTAADWRAGDLGNAYVRAKTQAERLAWQLAGELDLDLVSVLPSTIVGPVYGSLSMSMTLLDQIAHGALATAPDFFFTFVDTRDVAAGMIAAAGKGRAGERYLLAGDQPMGIARLAELARAVFPQAREPRLIPRRPALVLATAMEATAALTGRPPAILPSQVRMWYRADETYDTGPARRELGWQPRSSEQAVREAFAALAAAR